MALPFIAGLALGSVAMLAFTKRDTLQKELTLGARKAKELANKGLEQSKEAFESVRAGMTKKDVQSEFEQETDKQSKRKKKAEKTTKKQAVIRTGRRGRPRHVTENTEATEVTEIDYKLEANETIKNPEIAKNEESENDRW